MTQEINEVYKDSIEHAGTEITETVLPEDKINTWKNEIWQVNSGNGTVLYNKPKTWQNCWVKHGLVLPANGGDNHLYINYNNSEYSKFQFPLITNLQDYIEQGGSLANALKQEHIPNELMNELYRIHSDIDWSKSKFYGGYYRSYNYIGSIWFTHAYNAKGVNFGRTGWANQWTYKFTKNNVHSVGGIQEGISLPFFHSGSNISNVKFQFGKNVRITNAQGMFKALQVGLNLGIENLDGQPIVSSATEGFSPFVLVECFKQTAGNITSIPGNIYYGNCHSIGQFIVDNWVCTEIKPFNNAQIGEATAGNTLTLNYPSNGTYPNYGRNNWRAFTSSTLTTIGPLIDGKHLTDTTIFEGSANLVEFRLRNLNGANWNFSHLKKASKESVQFLLNNVYDRVANYVDRTGMNATQVRESLISKPVLDRTVYTITCPVEWEQFIDQTLINKVIDRGWKLVIGTVEKFKV